MARMTNTQLLVENAQLRTTNEDLRRERALKDEIISRLSAQLEERDNENRQLRTSCEELGARVRTRTTINHSHQVVSPTKARFMIQKRLAITLKTQVKWSEEHGFQCYENGEWVQVPQHHINYVTHDLQD